MNIRQKILSGAAITGCGVLILYAAAKTGEWSAGGTVPVSLMDSQSEKPVIILDAGHKERVLSIVILIHFICLLSVKRALI